MDATSLIDNAQHSYATGLAAQAAAKGAALKGATPDMQRARETAKDFEAFFIGQMMEQMMAGIETNSVFGGGHGEEMWRSMLNQEYGKEIAKSGKLGIADHVMRGMLQAQEERDRAAGKLPGPESARIADPAAVAVPPASAFMPIRR